MKSVRFLLPLLLLLCTFSLCGCTSKEEKKIEDAVKQELDQLKNLDSVTTQKYISYQELFPGEPEDIAISSDIEEVFSLFFQDFDYKILDINVDKDKQSAQANLRLVTLDAHALAEDFSKAQLKHEISQSASSEEATEQTISLEERYTLLNELLKSNDYQTVERNCTISLDASDKDGETSWEIRRTNTLENDLVGGLMNDLTDPDILSPEDTILVYLNTLKNMSAEELGNYLNADSIISTEDPAKISLAEALVKQVHSTFDYSIGETTVSGYTATVTANITTFDSDAILENYQKELDTYLASVDAVIDGAQKRYEKSYSLLLEYIEENTATKTVETTFTLINDGASWKLEDAGTVFGQALFGTLSSSPVEDKQETKDDIVKIYASANLCKGVFICADSEPKVHACQSVTTFFHKKNPTHFCRQDFSVSLFQVIS